MWTRIGVALLAVGCGKSNTSEDKVMEAPELSAGGDKVPRGHETTFLFEGASTRLEYTWLEISNVESKPALRILAQGGPHHGMLTITVPIPPNTTKLDQLVGIELGALPSGVSFGNTPVMATGTGGWIKIAEVTQDHVSGTFEAQACEHGHTTCTKPMHATNGTFDAFRSKLSDDKAFSTYSH